MPNNHAVLNLLDIYEPVEIDQKTYLFIVLEYIESDVLRMLESAKMLNLQEDHIVLILYRMLCSLNFLHSANIMHRDIRPESFKIDT